MRKILGVAFGVAALVTGASVEPACSQQTLEFEGRTWITTSSDAKVEYHLGREALLLRNGGVFLPDMEFQDGVIEYDMATTGHRSFLGAAFRFRQEPRVEYEHFYLRPHQTGRFDATQYTPEINGIAAWQLYGEFNAPVEIPTEEWLHVRLEITGPRLEAWVGHGDRPVLVVEDLRLSTGPGLVGLTSNFPQAGALDLYPTAYSNIRIVPAQPTEPQAPASPAADPGVITEWALSPSQAGPAGDLMELDAAALDALSWEAVPTDARGRINIAQHRSFVPGTPGAHVYARIVIESERAQTRGFNFGFSDVGRVFLNGRLLFSGNNTYRSRSLRYLGAMTVDNDALYLPLEAGANELVIVVSESFGGWGLMARISQREGITVRPGLAPGG